MIQPKTTLFSFLLCLFTGASAQTTHYDFKDGDLFYRILSPRDSTVEVAGGGAPLPRPTPRSATKRRPCLRKFGCIRRCFSARRWLWRPLRWC